jgi:hypothetical protein
MKKTGIGKKRKPEIEKKQKAKNPRLLDDNYWVANNWVDSICMPIQMK